MHGFLLINSVMTRAASSFANYTMLFVDFTTKNLPKAENFNICLHLDNFFVLQYENCDQMLIWFLQIFPKSTVFTTNHLQKNAAGKVKIIWVDTHILVLYKFEH